MADGGEIESLQLPLAWVGLDELAAPFANVFIVQVNDEDIIFTAGLASPPAFGDDTTPEQRKEMLEQMGAVVARPVVRLALNRKRLDDLKAAVDGGIAIWERQHVRGDDDK
jgi:hypothetical protein